MSLSLYGVPDGQQKGQSTWPCPSVYSPATALGSLSSVALSSAPAPVTLSQRSKQDTNYHHSCTRIWSGFLDEATNAISSGFLGEATGQLSQWGKRPQPRRLRRLRALGILIRSSQLFVSGDEVVCEQLAFDCCKLIVDHAEQVELTAASKSKVLHCVCDCFRVCGVLNGSHEHEQRSCGFIAAAADNLRQCFDLVCLRIRFIRFVYLRDVAGISFLSIGLSH